MTDLLQILDESGNKVGKAPRIKKELLLRMYRAMTGLRAAGVDFQSASLRLGADGVQLLQGG